MQKILKVILSSNSFVKFKLYSNIIQILNFVQTIFNAILIKLSKTLFKSKTMFKLCSNIYSFIICKNCLVFRKKAKYYNASLVPKKVNLQK